MSSRLDPKASYVRYRGCVYEVFVHAEYDKDGQVGLIPVFCKHEDMDEHLFWVDPEHCVYLTKRRIA